MNNEVDTFSGMLRLLLARIAETLQGLSESQLNWRPPVPKANSAYAIATHTLSNARAWVLGIACGQPMNRDRPAEFRASGPSAAALVDEAKRLAQDIEAALAPLTSADLDRRLVPAPDLWGEGQPYEISVREALIHVVEHAATHLGHLQLTRDLALENA